MYAPIYERPLAGNQVVKPSEVNSLENDEGAVKSVLDTINDFAHDKLHSIADSKTVAAIRHRKELPELAKRSSGLPQQSPSEEVPMDSGKLDSTPKEAKNAQLSRGYSFWETLKGKKDQMIGAVETRFKDMTRSSSAQEIFVTPEDEDIVVIITKIKQIPMFATAGVVTDNDIDAEASLLRAEIDNLKKNQGGTANSKLEFLHKKAKEELDIAVKKAHQSLSKIERAKEFAKEKVLGAEEKLSGAAKSVFSKETLHSTEDKVKELAEAAKDSIYKTEEKLKETFQTAEEKAKETVRAAKETAVVAAEKVKDKTEAIAKPVVEKYEEEKEKVYAKVKEARDQAEEQKKKADQTMGTYKEQAGELIEQAKETLTRAKDYTTETAIETAEKATHLAGQGVEKVKETGHHLANATESALGKVEDRVEEMKESAEEMKRKATERAQGPEKTGKASQMNR